MEQVVTQEESLYRQRYRERQKDRMAEPVWLIERRQAAIDAFEAEGFPTKRIEAWRNIDLTAVAQADFANVRIIGNADARAEELAGLLPQAWRLVFVDGEFSEKHSRLPENGLTVRPLLQALATHDALLKEHFGSYAPKSGHAFAALNTALFEDGALVHLARGAVIEEPVLILHLASDKADGHAVHSRCLVVAEEGAQVKLVELYQGVEDAVYLSTPVTEIAVGANASVAHHKVQLEGAKAHHFGVIAARLQRDARLSVHSLAIGGKQARTDITVDLDGPGAEAELDGLYLTVDGQYSDHHTTVRHLVDHCNSHQLFKGVLTGKSEAVYDGLVEVAKGAQKTDARQENRNLLLSKRALAHSNPRLEIYADDVKCSHGSSTGELDPEALFYLRSRGIGPEDAQGLLTIAFINEVLDAVKIDELRAFERGVALRLLPGDQTVKELA